MNGTLRYALVRTAQALVVVLFAYVLTFTVITVLPGDPISNRLSSPEYQFSEEDIARITAYYGLDKPAWQQLLISLGNALHGDFGFSLRSERPVTEILAAAIPSTLTLASLALLFAIVLAALISFGAVFLPPRFGGDVLRVFPSLFLSVPNFLIGLLLIQVFSFKLGLFTLSDQRGLAAAVFPALTLAVPVSAQITQVLITSLDAVRRQPYVTVAVAKGLSPLRVFVSHLLKPSSLPVVTILALTVGEVLGGSVITEAVFGRNGVGSVVESAVVDQDLPVLQAAVMLAAAVFVAVNLVTDLVYPLLDPRLRVRQAV